MTEPPPRANFSATANQVCSVIVNILRMYICILSVCMCMQVCMQHLANNKITNITGDKH